MLPPSPSAPRSFDSSAYSSPHLQTPSSANSNTGEDLCGRVGFYSGLEIRRRSNSFRCSSPSHPGLISPGVSVPVQVPGAEQQNTSHNLGQYWARLQWTTDNGRQQKKEKEGRVTKRCQENKMGRRRTERERERRAADPKRMTCLQIQTRAALVALDGTLVILVFA